MEFCIGKYSAFTVSKYAVDYAKFSLGRFLENSKLQRILYYIQGVSLKVFGEPMFYEEFTAWTYGPVVLDVSYAYNSIDKLASMTKETLDEKSEEIIRRVVDKFVDMDIETLNNKVCSEDPWKLNYMHHKQNKIPLHDFEDWFCEGR